MARKARQARGATRGVKRRRGRPLRRQCGAMVAHYRLLEIDRGFRERQQALERVTARRMAPGVALRKKSITIPVVVHVVYNQPDENISAAQVKSQIRVLNRDFQARNPDRKKTPEVWKGMVANVGVRFTLAKKDPNGGNSTGITRTKTTRTSFSDDDAVKSSATGGADPWPADKYMNVWVCNLQPWLGYAQFPGGPLPTDGVVIVHTAFGTSGTAAAPFNLGRTATHEIGHWLNLRHIWGDTEDCSGSDVVDDTPNAAGPNYGKPAFPHVSCNNGPNGDMFMNYMDYVDDESMFMFTPQQVSRMQTALADSRSTIGR